MGYKIVIIVLAWLALCGPSFSYAESAAPAFVATTLDGKLFDTAALKGKVVVVHFWATWCPACREEMPALDAFYLRHAREGVEVIAISLDREHDRKDVMAVMRDFHFPAALIADAKVNDFGAPAALPVTYILDGQGALRKTLTPDTLKLTLPNMENTVLPLLPPKTN